MEDEGAGFRGPWHLVVLLLSRVCDCRTGLTIPKQNMDFGRGCDIVNLGKLGMMNRCIQMRFCV